MASPSSDGVLTVLIASTAAWEFPARVAMAFAELGWHVEAICGRGDPMERTRSVRRIHRYNALRPLAALSRTMKMVLPDLIVPCDDPALDDILLLHRQLHSTGRVRHAAIANMIAKSIGNPTNAASARGRAAFIEIARNEAIRAPLTIPVLAEVDLRPVLQEVGLPAVLKVDRSWGGLGVRIAHTLAQVEEAFAELSLKPSVVKAMKRFLVNRDPFPLQESLRHRQRHVSMQAFIEGRPANCIAACQAGEVLAIVQVAVEKTEHAMGPSAIVRVIDHPDMAEAARRIVGRLGLSGFVGLDFVIEAATGLPHLVEMNQRMTPTGHFALGEGRDPIAALTAHYSGSRSQRRPMTQRETIALFPTAWQSLSNGDLLADSYHDVPTTDPDLIRELVLPPWHERGFLARLIDQRLRKRRKTGGAASFPLIADLFLHDAPQNGGSIASRNGIDVTSRRAARITP